ncbi:MAG: hypothetical protein NC132_04585 [Corallococcus sp.]|nr:hypothetical protein [Corallococcus sp.]MCM1359663.1 hypothetical protein [Corallococcus sp.]MCM1395372.1 hypothetical protein [Corallococcus sp.]
MDYGKFASLDELVKGYNNLEKSFTQKCQQLAETQRQNRDLSQQLAQTFDKTYSASDETAVKEPTAPIGATADGAEFLKTHITLGTNAPTPPSGDGSDSVHSTTVERVESVPLDADADAASDLSDLAPVEATPSDEQLQQYLLKNPEFAQKLLQSGSAEFAPSVMCGGGNVPLAPPSRPKSIKEASLMAKDLFSSH